MKCPNCEKEISMKLDACPFCKAPIVSAVIKEEQIRKRFEIGKYFEWQSLQISQQVMTAYIAIVVPFLLRVLQNEAGMFDDFIAVPVTMLIYIACDYLLIPLTFSKFLEITIEETSVYKREGKRMGRTEIITIVVAFVLMVGYIRYLQEAIIMIITIGIFFFRIAFKYISNREK